MYREYQETDGGWVLLNEYETLPKRFSLQAGQRLEYTGENGVTTIVEEIPIPEADNE